MVYFYPNNSTQKKNKRAPIIFFLTRMGFLYLYNPKTKGFRVFSKENWRSASAICAIQGTIYIVADKIYRFETSTKNNTIQFVQKVENHEQWGNTLCACAHGKHLYIMVRPMFSASSLYKYDTETGQYSVFLPSHPWGSVKCMVAENDKLYVFDDWLHRVDLNTKQVTKLSNENGWDAVKSACIMPDGKMYCLGSKLYQYNPDTAEYREYLKKPVTGPVVALNKEQFFVFNPFIEVMDIKVVNGAKPYSNENGWDWITHATGVQIDDATYFACISGTRFAHMMATAPEEEYVTPKSSTFASLSEEEHIVPYESTKTTTTSTTTTTAIPEPAPAVANVPEQQHQQQYNYLHEQATSYITTPTQQQPQAVQWNIEQQPAYPTLSDSTSQYGAQINQQGFNIPSPVATSWNDAKVSTSKVAPKQDIDSLFNKMLAKHMNEDD